jgi:hypothetical protein
MTETYTKETLVKRIADIFEISPRLAAEICNEVWITVLDALAQGGQVTYPGFGTFTRFWGRDSTQHTIKFFAHNFALDVVNGRPCKDNTLHKEDKRLQRMGVLEEDAQCPEITMHKEIQVLRGLLEEAVVGGSRDQAFLDRVEEAIRRGV